MGELGAGGRVTSSWVQQNKLGSWDGPVKVRSLAFYSGAPDDLPFQGLGTGGRICVEGWGLAPAYPSSMLGVPLVPNFPASPSPDNSCLPFRLLPRFQPLQAPLQRVSVYVLGRGQGQTSREGLKSHGAPLPPAEGGSRRPDRGKGEGRAGLWTSWKAAA